MTTPAKDDQVPPLVIESVDPEKMKLMAALLRDPNPIHLDAEAVKALGLGDRVINQGPTNLSYLVNMVMREFGDASRVRQIDVRFLGNVFAGDRVECSGVVTDVDPQTERITLEVRAAANDQPVLAGTIVVSI
jgi:acyl dehydratase